MVLLVNTSIVIDDIRFVSGLYEGIEIVIDDDDGASLEDLLHATGEPPAIRLANVIIMEADRLGASDIHVHPRAKSVVVRYRIDGTRCGTGTGTGGRPVPTRPA